MKTTLFNRFVSLAAVLFLVSLASFLLMEFLPGDPSTALVAIWSGVIGKYDDIVGVWIAPVTAHVMMTFRVAAIV